MRTVKIKQGISSDELKLIKNYTVAIGKLFTVYKALHFYFFTVDSLIKLNTIFQCYKVYVN